MFIAHEEKKIVVPPSLPVVSSGTLFPDAGSLKPYLVCNDDRFAEYEFALLQSKSVSYILGIAVEAA
jgi:hypothetical protein